MSDINRIKEQHDHDMNFYKKDLLEGYEVQSGLAVHDVAKLFATIATLTRERDEANRLLAESQYLALQIAGQRGEAEKDLVRCIEVNNDLRAENAKLRGRVESAIELVDEAMETYSTLEDDHPYFVDIIDDINRVLK